MIKNVFTIVLLSITLAFFNAQLPDFPTNSDTDNTNIGAFSLINTAETAAPVLKKDLRKSIFRFAKKHIGIKYKSGGRNPKGFDCSGFTWYVMNHFNIDIPTNSWSQAKAGRKIDLKDAKTGDLIFFGKGKKVNHVGLVIYHKNGKLRVIHSTSSKGIVKQDVSVSGYWKSRILFARDVIPKV